MPQFIFDKYDSLIKRPNGRPVGVRNGQGQQPQAPSSPALSGMKHAVEGARDSLVRSSGYQPTPGFSYSGPSAAASTLQGAKKKAMAGNQSALKRQTDVGRAIDTMSEWLEALK